MSRYLRLTNYESLAVAASFVLVAQFVYFRLVPKPIPDIPHNPIMSIWGDLSDITQFMAGGKKTFSEWLATMVHKHGPISQVILGHTPTVIVADRLEAERILLRGKSTDQSRRANAVFAIAIPTSQISQPTNEIWKRHRRLAGPSMSQRYLARMSPRLLSSAQNLVRLWEKKVELVGDMAFDADMDLQLATMDAIFDISMGISPGCIDATYDNLTALASTTKLSHIPPTPSPPLHSALRNMMEGFGRAGQGVFPALTALLFLWPSPTWRKSYNMLTSLCNKEIANARAREGRANDHELLTDADCVVDMIVQREVREGAENFGKDELVDELLTYLFGGHDTTVAALGWLVKYLPLDLEIQQRLHREIRTIFELHENGDAISLFEALDNPDLAPTLEAVVTETLRCAGVAPQISRELTDDQVILGRHVPKGTHVMFTTVLMGKQESDWGPDAKVWRPNRWLRPDGSYDRLAGPSVPFGMGQRSCFGQRLAVVQMKVFLATMSREFVFKPLLEELDIWDAAEFVTRQPKKCFVSLEKWQ